MSSVTRYWAPNYACGFDAAMQIASDAAEGQGRRVTPLKNADTFSLSALGELRTAIVPVALNVNAALISHFSRECCWAENPFLSQ